MSIGKGIAIVGIWTTVAIVSFSPSVGEGLPLVFYVAMIATFVVTLFD